MLNWSCKKRGRSIRRPGPESSLTTARSSWPRTSRNSCACGKPANVLTSPHYPQSNGKLERYHRTLKEQALRPKTPLSLEDARRVVAEFVDHYNNVRLHSALGYVAPRDRLEGRHQQIYVVRDRKLEAAREQRRQRRGQVEVKL